MCVVIRNGTLIVVVGIEWKIIYLNGFFLIFLMNGIRTSCHQFDNIQKKKTEI